MADDAPSTPAAPANPLEPADPQPISQPKLLIGEGKDEVEFFRAFARYLNIADVQIEQYGGKDGLPAYLEAIRVRPGFAQLVSLGVTRDADKSAQSTFQSVQGSLRSNAFPVPSRPGQAVAGPPKTSVFIFPGRGKKGMLEDLCLASVATDKAMPCVDEFLRCVRLKARRKPRIPAKARVQAWLASQEKSDLQLGLAAQNKYWPWDDRAFAGLTKFLRSL